jgi:hypothetical protein
LKEILGEFDIEVRDKGKCRISAKLREVQDTLESAEPLQEEVEELKEKLEKERKRNNILACSNEGLMEERRNTVAEAKFEKIANFLADTIKCSRGRPVDTLIGAVKEYIEDLEFQAGKGTRFRNLKSETARKTEELKKVKEKEKELSEELKKVKEREKELSEVVIHLHRELKQAAEAAQGLSQQKESPKKQEMVEVGIQATPNMVSVATEPDLQIGKEKEEKQKKAREKKKGKEKSGKIEQSPLKEDTVMREADRSSPYEDLSEYEKEVDDWVASPAARKPTKGPAGKPRPAKNRHSTRAADQEVSTKAFVVHAISCNRPAADTTQDLRRIGMRGILGSRWLLGEHRRAGKATSSVVIFLDREVSFQTQDSQLKMKIRGRWHPVSVYDFDRGRF